VGGDAGRPEWANRRLREYTGETQEGLCGEGGERLAHPADLRAYREAWQAALRAEQPLEAEVRLRDADGAYRWHLMRAAPQRGAGGAVAYWLGVGADINAYKRTDEVRLAQVERERIAREAADAERGRLRELFQQAPAIVAVLRGAGHTFELANARFLQLVGTRDMVGKPVREALPELAGQGFFELLDRVYSTGEPFVGQAVPARLDRRGDGTQEEGFFDFVYEPLRDGEGAVDGVFVHAVEVTQQVRAQQALAQRAALASTVGAALTAGGTLRQMLQACAEAAVEQLEAAFARVWTLDGTGRVLELQASAGMYTHLDGPHGRVPVGQFKIGQIAQERRPHLTNAVLGDPRVGDQDWARREGMVAFAGYPLLVEDRLVGVLALFARQALPEFALDALASVAQTVATGIERKRAEAALAHQLEVTRAITDNAASCLFMMDVDGHPTFMNPAAERVTGYQLDEIRDRPLHNAVHYKRPDGRPFPIEECPIDNAASELAPVHDADEVFVRKDGTLFPVRYSVAPLERDGRTVGAVLEFRDVSVERTA